MEDGHGNKIPLKVQTDYQIISSHIIGVGSGAIDITFTAAGQGGLIYCSISNSSAFVLINMYIPGGGSASINEIGSNVLSAQALGDNKIRISGFNSSGYRFVNILSGNLKIETISNVEP